MPKFLLVQRHSFCAVHVTRRWVQSAECANRGIQCVHLLCYLVTFSPQQFKYVHAFVSGRGLYRRSGKCALVCPSFPRLTSLHTARATILKVYWYWYALSTFSVWDVVFYEV